MSGKSLLEYMLTDKSDLKAGYENQLLYKTVSNMNKETDNLFDVRRIQEEYLGTIRKKYLQLHNAFFKDKLLTTSTRPNDIFLLLPFLQALPEMRLIACFRNQVDIAISMFMRDYETGNNYNSDLKNCLHYINHYQQTMDLLHDLFPDQIIKVHYEDLITKPEQTVNTIFKFLQIDSYGIPEIEFNLQNIGISEKYKAEISKIQVISENK